MTIIKMDTIKTKVNVYEMEVKKYGKRGLKALLENIIERYFHPEYYDTDLLEDIEQGEYKD